MGRQILAQPAHLSPADQEHRGCFACYRGVVEVMRRSHDGGVTVTEEPNKKKYREPLPGRETELVERFRAAGIGLRIEDVEPGESRLMFFGPGVADRRQPPAEEEDEEG